MFEIGAQSAESIIMYEQLNQKIESMSKWLRFFMISMLYASAFIPIFCQSLFNYYVNDMGEESFKLTFPFMYVHSEFSDEARTYQAIHKWFIFLRFRLPYNWKKPLTYSLTMLFNGMTCVPEILSVVSTGVFLTGSCWFIILFVKDITEDLEFLHVGGVSTNESRVKMKERFCNIIQNYLDVKQLSPFSPHFLFVGKEKCRNSMKFAFFSDLLVNSIRSMNL